MPQPISILRALALAWAVALLPLSSLLLFSAVTIHGRWFAIGAILLSLAPMLAWLNPDHRRLRQAALVAILGWLGITAWLVAVSPDGHPRSGARVENRYVGGNWRYHRLALGAVLPEVDQFMLGFRLVPAIDPLLSYEEASPLAKDTRDIYAELEADPDFHALGSSLPDAYSELWRGLPHKGHYFLYVPRTLDRKTPAPALIFLHGFGGNFKSYVWLLSRAADERGMIVVAPSCGMGYWKSTHASGIVAAALEDAAKLTPIDMSQVHLAGLSNGGLGVSRTAASEHSGRFRSLILLSAICDSHALESTVFAEKWHGKPVLVLTGELDDRVPIDYVKEYSKVIQKAGAQVEVKTYADANHFLVFSHRDRFLKEVSEWLGKVK